MNGFLGSSRERAGGRIVLAGATLSLWLPSCARFWAPNDGDPWKGGWGGWDMFLLGQVLLLTYTTFGMYPVSWWLE